jgi:hypothetical protein
MKITQHPFQSINWKKVEKIKHSGDPGFALWQTIIMADIRIRMVEYSEGYVADHWCDKGHVIFCINGKMITELKDGRKMKLKKGISYHVGDNSEAHRSSTKKGCKLFIVD